VSDKDLFYIFGIGLAVSAVVLTFAGLKLRNFPGKGLPVIVLYFLVMVVGASTFAVRESKHEAHAREAEHHKAAEEIEEGSSGPYENEAGALGGEREELEEQAEEEAPGSTEEEPVGPTEDSQLSPERNKQGEDDSAAGGSGAEASTTLQLAADPATIAFDKEELSAKAGKVTIEFDNPSAIPHNVVIEKDDEELAGTPEFTEGKKSVSTELEAGSYTFVCTVPGHEEAGMVGTLTVE
jgi:plastocyanin